MERITPAPAGKTYLLKLYGGAYWDHPRTCGENEKFGEIELCQEGSPPHLRGKRCPIKNFSCHFRITPAPAGKTNKSYYNLTIYPDHPRTCGENFLQNNNSTQTKGSPPHLRGKHENILRGALRNRITPAPAGKTEIEENSLWKKGDHPRTCGENQFFKAVKFNP